MTDGDALLAAVLRDPDDDAPRLIYADWLDENDHSAQARWIRDWIVSGVQYHHPINCFFPWSCSFWGPVNSDGPRWVWHRGFVRAAHDTLLQLLANGPALANVQPVVHFEPTDRQPYQSWGGQWGWDNYFNEGPIPCSLPVPLWGLAPSY